MRQDFLFSMNCVSLNQEEVKVYVIQSKNGIIMNVAGSLKNHMIGVLGKLIIRRILDVLGFVTGIKHVALMNI